MSTKNSNSKKEIKPESDKDDIGKVRKEIRIKPDDLDILDKEARRRRLRSSKKLIELLCEKTAADARVQIQIENELQKIEGIDEGWIHQGDEVPADSQMVYYKDIDSNKKERLGKGKFIAEHMVIDDPNNTETYQTFVYWKPVSDK